MSIEFHFNNTCTNSVILPTLSYHFLNNILTPELIIPTLPTLCTCVCNSMLINKCIRVSISPSLTGGYVLYLLYTKSRSYQSAIFPYYIAIVVFGKVRYIVRKHGYSKFSCLHRYNVRVNIVQKWIRNWPSEHQLKEYPTTGCLSYYILIYIYNYAILK